MMHLFNDGMRKTVSEALNQLLCEKHLYQSIEVDLKPLLEVSKRINMEMSEPGYSRQQARPPGTVKELAESEQSCVNIPWIINGCNMSGATSNMVPFALPHINTFCGVC